MPNTSVVIRTGDIINLDITLEKNGYIADSSKTYLVGEVWRTRPCGKASPR
ncbi:hypothetical protein GCM10019060_39700 [Novosphingobium pokkalii]|nr:hypothetical protein GCM10019060_39700 [Novosphingobium pokkalii]